MRHKKGNKKLSRPTDQRMALLKGLVQQLFLHGSIQTTETRAMEAKKLAEKLITLAKKGTVYSRRLVLKVVPHKEIVKQLFNEVAPKYKDRNGGYTRLYKLGFRKGDAASVAKLELID